MKRDIRLVVKVSTRDGRETVGNVIGTTDSKELTMELIKEQYKGKDFGFYDKGDGMYMVSVPKDDKVYNYVYREYETVFIEKDPPEEYHFKTKGFWKDTCIEKCNLKDAMIGSVACQECEFNAGNGPSKSIYKGPEWIKCSRLKEAKGEA